MKIFLNPGHGGSDPGAVSKSGTKEKDIALKICEYLAIRLRQNLFQVEMYQQVKSLNEVVPRGNKSKSDLFISVHCNSFSNQSANAIFEGIREYCS